MNFRTTAILLALAAIGLVAAIAYVTLAEKPTPDVALPNMVGVKVSDIDSVEIKRTSPKREQLDFFRDSQGRWATRGATPQRVDANTILSVVRGILAAKPIAHSDASADLKSLSLDSPTVSITLRVGSERAATLNLGLITIGGQDAVVFVTTGEDPTHAFAIPRDAIGAVFIKPEETQGEPASQIKWLTDYRERTLMAADWQSILQQSKTLRIRKGTTEIKLEREVNGNRWMFATPAGLGEADLDGDPNAKPEVFTGIRPILNFLATLTVRDTKDFVENLTTDQMITLGLTEDAPNGIRVELTPMIGEMDVLYLGHVVDPNAKPTQIYARKLGDTFAVKVTTDRLAAFHKTIAEPAYLRNRDLLAFGVRDAVQRVEIIQGTTNLVLKKAQTQTGSSWVIDGTPVRPVALQSVEKLLAELAKPRLALDFATMAEATPLCAVSLFTTGEVGAKPAYQLRFTQSETRVVAERLVNGKTTGFLVVPGELIPWLKKSRLDYLHAVPPSFASNFAVSLKLEHGKTVYEVALNGESWINTKTQTPVDTIKVKALLDGLSVLTPQSIVAENPKDDVLKTFGLDAENKVKVTVGHKVLVDGKDVVKEAVFELGSPSEDKTRAFARHEGSDLVYAVNANVVLMVRAMVK